MTTFQPTDTQATFPWTEREYVDLLQGSLDHLLPGIAVYDPQDRLLFCNRRMREIYPEIGHLFVVGMPYAEIARGFYRYRHDRVQHLSEAEYVAQRVANHIQPSGVDEEYQNHDGSWLLVWDRKTPNGCIIGFRLDISARKQAEMQLREVEQAALLRLEDKVRERTEALASALQDMRDMQDSLVQSEKLASLGRMVAGIAHEINTPLGNAQLAASAVSEKVREFRDVRMSSLTKSALVDLLDSVEHGMKLAQAGLQRAAVLVRDFKDAAVQRNSRQISTFNLREQVKYVEVLMHHLLKKSRPSFAYDIAPDIVMESDAGAIEQIVSNLINNSLIHGFRGRQDGSMTLKATLDNEQVVLVYQDDGVGMDAETLSKLFDPFFTTRLGSGGSGLGMFVVYNLVTSALGGTIQVQSTPGQGCAYQIRVPRLRHRAA